ncbi:MAG: response regulator transcription factor [Coriobacteriales bacterium]|jgi:DNA-binding response OmpR family regulator|nr:response regulator transcription factor [Coriobacteriales bacterium]
MRILLVEDERQLSEALVALLKQHDYQVDAVFDGITGQEYALLGSYSALVLDVMLPGKSGFEVLRALRAAGVATPVLLLTAKAGVGDRIAGLDLGADDYLIKPFAAGELLARLRAITRRKGELIADEIALGNTVLDCSTHLLSNGRQAIRLGNREFLILELLLKSHPRIIPKDRFADEVMGTENTAEYNAIEVYVSFLRKKLVAVQSDLTIKATRGVGYSIEVVL